MPVSEAARGAHKVLARLFGKIGSLFILLTSLLSAVFGVIYLGEMIWDWNTLAFSTPEKEKAAATEQFLWSCGRNHLNPKAFLGPFRDYDDTHAHSWVWKLRAHGDEHISVHITYMPYEISDTISNALSGEQHQP